MTGDNERLFEIYQADFTYCEAVIKQHSKSFYTAFSQLPKRKAQSVYAIYAFCRQADDLIDLEGNIEGLDQLEQQLTDFEAGKVPNTPIWRALAVVFATFPMDLAPFYDMLNGQRKDISFTQPKDMKSLEDYCYYVAGSVGLMLLPLLTDQATKIAEPAKKLGEAMQLTNILRDVGEDYQMGRVYLPKEEMEKFQVTEETLENKATTPAFIALWESLAVQAEERYRQSFEMLPLIHKDCQLALTAAAFIYREQLEAIRKNHYQVFTRKNKISHFRKLQLLREVTSYLEKINRTSFNKKNAELLSIGINNISMIYDPDIIVVNSPLYRKLPVMIDYINNALSSRFTKEIIVRNTLLGEKAILFGGVAVIAQHFLNIRKLKFKECGTNLKISFATDSRINSGSRSNSFGNKPKFKKI